MTTPTQKPQPDAGTHVAAARAGFEARIDTLLSELAKMREAVRNAVVWTETLDPVARGQLDVRLQWAEHELVEALKVLR